MADEPVNAMGIMTPEASQKVRDHLAAKFTKPCPSCGHTQFVVSDRIYAPMALTVGREFDFANSYPMVMVLCTNCFHVLPFGVRPIGIYGPQEETPE